MMAVMWTLTSIALILVAARLCVRTRILRNLGDDDWLIALAMVKHAFLCSRWTEILTMRFLVFRHHICRNLNDLRPVWLRSTF